MTGEKMMVEVVVETTGVTEAAQQEEMTGEMKMEVGEEEMLATMSKKSSLLTSRSQTCSMREKMYGETTLKKPL